MLISEQIKQEENHSDISSSQITQNKEDMQSLYEIESESLVKIKAGDNANERLISAAHNGDLENVKKALWNDSIPILFLFFLIN